MTFAKAEACLPGETMKIPLRRAALLGFALVGLAACSREPDISPGTAQPDGYVSPAQAAAFLRTCEGVRLDAPSTPENSFLVELAPGAVLRMPKCLAPSLDFAKLKQPFQAPSVGMTFSYPEMTLTDWAPSVDVILEKQRGVYVPKTDHFPVHILWMYYVPPDSDNFVPGSKQPPRHGPDPRPPRINLNLHCYKFANGRCNDDMRRVPSGIRGIDALHAGDWIKTHPEAATHHLQKGGAYVATPEAPYELFMNCDGFKGVQCQAYVYGKKHHLQYRMVFPPEAVAHTDELIRSIEKTLDGWSTK